MLRLRACIASHLLSSPSTSAISTPRRLISAAAPVISLNPGFAVEDCLIGTCGLTRPQAIKASTQLSRLKSSSKPDAVLAFFAGLGISSADMAATVAKDPKLLCASVERTLAPKVTGLTSLGLSGPDIGRLMPRLGTHFRHLSVASNLQFYLPFFGSLENFLRAVKRNAYLPSFDIDSRVKSNVALLRECGLDVCDIDKLCISVPRMLTAQPQSVRATVACAERIGVTRGSGMFRQVLQAVAFLSEEKIGAQVNYLKKMFRWSNDEVSVAVSKAPLLLRRSKDILRRVSEFLISEVGLEPVYIAHRSVMICYSMEGRLRPQYYVLKFLKVNGLIDQNRDYYTTVSPSEEVFVKKFICPHKEAAPHLTEDYGAAWRGEVPIRFRFT